MDKAFIDKLNEKFPGQFELVPAEEGQFVKFPAQSPDFGDVLIYEEEPGAYIVVLGEFTHSHCEICDHEYGLADHASAMNEDVFWLLEEVFADRIICWNLKDGGAYAHKEHWHRPDRYDGFVWSGKYNN